MSVSEMNNIPLEKLNIKGACGEALKELMKCTREAKNNKYMDCWEAKQHFNQCLHWNPEWPADSNGQ